MQSTGHIVPMNARRPTMDGLAVTSGGSEWQESSCRIQKGAMLWLASVRLTLGHVIAITENTYAWPFQERGRWRVIVPLESSAGGTGGPR